MLACSAGCHAVRVWLLLRNTFHQLNFVVLSIDWGAVEGMREVWTVSGVCFFFFWAVLAMIFLL